jgi:hypothetical protein
VELQHLKLFCNPLVSAPLIWSFPVLTPVGTARSYQQVLLLDPLQTAVRFIPMAIAGVGANVLGGWLMSRVPSQILVVGGLMGDVVSIVHFHEAIS